GGYFGFAEIASGVRGAGWGILAVIAFHPVQMVFSALGWRVLVQGPLAPGLIAFTGLRWIREGVNNLLPVAQSSAHGCCAAMGYRSRRAVPVSLSISPSNF